MNPAGGKGGTSASPFRIPSEKDRIVKLFENLPRAPVLKRPDLKPRAPSRAPEPIRLLEREAAVKQCEQASDPRQVVLALLGYGTKAAKRAILFYPKGHMLHGLDGAGDGFARASVPALEFDLAKPSVFRNFTHGAACYLGPMPRTDVNDSFVKLTGGQRPGGALIVPVLAGDRAANLLYLDNGHARETDADLGELLLLTVAAGKAYERIIRSRRTAPKGT